MSSFSMNVSDLNGAVVATLAGPLDLTVGSTLERGLLGISARKPSLVILDFSAVTSISSLVMGQLVAFRGGVKRANGQLFFAGASPLIYECFRRARLHELFTFRDRIDECMPAT